MSMAFLQLCKTLKKENVSKQKEPSMGVNLWRVELGGEKETRFKTLSLKDILGPGVYCIKKTYSNIVSCQRPILTTHYLTSIL